MENEIVAVWCPTRDDWDKVQRKAFKDGREWRSGNRLHNVWDDYKEESCIYIDPLLKLDYMTRDFYRRKGTTILSATDYLSHGMRDCLNRPAYGLEGKRDFKLDDRVRALSRIEPMYEEKAGDEGVVIEACGAPLIKWDRDVASMHSKGRDCCYVNKHELELLPIKPKHTVPLRVDDRVRVVEGDESISSHLIMGEEGRVTQVFDNGNYYFQGEYMSNVCNPTNLELIPTEKDITVGSVWEREVDSGYIIEVTGFDKEGLIESSQGGVRSKEGILRNFKLIHRGDEVVAKSKHNTGMAVDWVIYDEMSDIDPTTWDKIKTKTNKKEKKMEFKYGYNPKDFSEGEIVVVDGACDGVEFHNQECEVSSIYESSIAVYYSKNNSGTWNLHSKISVTKLNKKGEKKMKKNKPAVKVIKIGDPVIDRNCSNEGVVVGVFPKTNQASYEDYNGGKVLTVSIDDLYLQFVAPKIVEVKPKKKKVVKKAAKKAKKVVKRK